MRAFFAEDIQQQKRPHLSKCRDFLANFNIVNKIGKQVQDKVYGLAKKN